MDIGKEKDIDKRNKMVTLMTFKMFSELCSAGKANVLFGVRLSSLPKALIKAFSDEQFGRGFLLCLVKSAH